MTKRYKILFIKPHVKVRPQFVELPMAFLYLSAYLKSFLKKDISIDLIDLRLERRPGKALTQKIVSFAPDLIGISLLTQDRDFLQDWCGHIRTAAPAAKIVIGGPYATYESEEALKHNRDIDLAVIGEGEKTFLNLVGSLINGESTQGVKGLAYRNGDSIVSHGYGEHLDDLDLVPFPDYDLITLKDYQRRSQPPMNAMVAKKNYTHVISSRGCPYRCTYCHDIFGKKVRFRTPENFVAEIRRLYEDYGVREFHVIDDIFNINKERMHRILKLIIESGMKLKLSFPNGLRSDILGRDDIRLLKQAGTYMITFAVETVSARIQKEIKKNLDVEKVLDNIEYAGKLGIITRGTFMIGFPGETPQEIKATINAAVRSKLDIAGFFAVIPFKNTEMGRYVEKMLPHVAHRIRGYFWDTRPFYQRATGYNLKRTQSLAYFRFYLPFRIIKTIIRTPAKISMLMWPYWALQVFLPGEPKGD